MKRFFLFIVFISFFSCTQEKKHIIQVLKLGDKNLSLDNGVLLYNKIPFSGVIKHFDSLNETQNSTPYFNGKKEGEELKKYINDSLAEQRFYTNGFKVGIHKGWWKNGQIKFEYHFNDKGAYDGAVKEWYKTGQPFKTFNFSNGKEVGAQKMWQLNGKISANYVVANYERFGLIGLKKCYSVNTKNETVDE